MTTAVCFRCGKLKFGAFCPCECGAMPQTEDELAISLAMTDHYFDEPTLLQIGAAVKMNGAPPALDPESHANIIALLRSTNMASNLQQAVAQPNPPAG